MRTLILSTAVVGSLIAQTYAEDSEAEKKAIAKIRESGALFSKSPRTTIGST